MTIAGAHVEGDRAGATYGIEERPEGLKYFFRPIYIFDATAFVILKQGHVALLDREVSYTEIQEWKRVWTMPYGTLNRAQSISIFANAPGFYSLKKIIEIIESHLLSNSKCRWEINCSLWTALGILSIRIILGKRVCWKFRKEDKSFNTSVRQISLLIDGCQVIPYICWRTCLRH